MAKDSDKGLLGPFFYLWFGLSILLNVSGIASIVDGFVHWANFFKDFLDIYREWIREPISWAAHLVWPSWWPKIPPWVFDLFVIWSAFFLARNIWSIRRWGRSAVSIIIEDRRGEGIFNLISIFVFFALGPLMTPVASLSDDEENRRGAREVLAYFFLLIATVIVLAFLNWQLQHIVS